MLNFLFKEFNNEIKLYYREKIKFTIDKDAEYRINLLKKNSWILLKNNIKSSINGKLRFLLSVDDYNFLINIFGETKFLSIFKNLINRLELLTYMNEINYFTISKIFDPSILGNPDKYYSVHLAYIFYNDNTSLKNNKKKVKLIFIIRDEMLLFPVLRISTDFLKTVKDSLYKKAFIELDKKIIWDSMKNWGTELHKGFDKYIENFNAYKYRLYPSDNVFAYRLLLQYLYLLKLLDREKRLK